jgi:hypothetical protein
MLRRSDWTEPRILARTSPLLFFQFCVCVCVCVENNARRGDILIMSVDCVLHQGIYDRYTRTHTHTHTHTHTTATSWFVDKYSSAALSFRGVLLSILYRGLFILLDCLFLWSKISLFLSNKHIYSTAQQRHEDQSESPIRRLRAHLRDLLRFR